MNATLLEATQVRVADLALPHVSWAILSDLRVHCPKKTAVVFSAFLIAHFFLGSGIGRAVSGPGLRRSVVTCASL